MFRPGGVYFAPTRRYGPPPTREARPCLAPRFVEDNPMKAEIQSVVDEIEQALSLLRRHL